LINSDERLKRLKDIIISVPCVGIQTAILILIYTNEFKDIQNPKKFACYAGVAPFPKESGKMKGKSRVSPFANKKVKAVLHLCAMTSVRNDSEIKAYYERKTLKEGKPKMAVLNAIRNKIILRIFACLNQDRLYLKDFINPLKGHHVTIVSSDMLQTTGPR
jgi:transposase